MRMTIVAGLAAGMFSGLALYASGAAAQQEPEQTQIQDWVVSCATADDGSRLCEMGQVVSINQGDERRPFLQILVGHLPQDRQARLRVMAPLGVLLQPGAEMQIDQGASNTIPFAVCTREGCIGEIALNDALVNSMKRGNEGTIALTMVNGQSFDIPFSLMGFTKSFDTVMQ